MTSDSTKRKRPSLKEQAYQTTNNVASIQIALGVLALEDM